MTERTVTTNAAECREKLAPVYGRYPGQAQPLSAYVELDPQKRTLTADCADGSMVPMTVWHGQQYRLRVSPYLTGTQVADLLEGPDLLTLAARVCDGHSIEWDGDNHVGKLTEDAREALDELEDLVDRRGMEGGTLTVTPPDEWVTDADDMDITSETTDAELAQMAERETRRAAQDDVLIEGKMVEWLTELRQRLRARADRLRLLTVGDAAAILGVSVRRVQALIKEHNQREPERTVGRQVGRQAMWLLTAEEVVAIRPGRPGRPGRPKKAR